MGEDNKYKKWNDLSIVEKLPYLQLAITSGIYNPITIGERYDNYIKGLQEQSYNNYIDRLAMARAPKWGISNEEALQEISNDNTYDYRSMYFDNPIKAESYINTDHFPDTYKYPNHPTFSDESIYSNNNVIDIPYLGNSRPNGGHWDGDIFRRALYQEATPQETQEYLVQNTPKHRTTNKVADEIYNTAIEAGFTREQALALLGNAYVESGFKKVKQNNGPAEGYYQFEPATKQKYEKWYSKNPNSGKKHSARSETMFIADLFKRRDPELNTPWSRAGGSKDSNKYRLAHSSFYKNRTTEDAFKDWESGNIEKTTNAFIRLFERPKYHKSSQRVAAATRFQLDYPDPRLNKPKLKLPVVSFDTLDTPKYPVKKFNKVNDPILNNILE